MLNLRTATLAGLIAFCVGGFGAPTRAQDGAARAGAALKQVRADPRIVAVLAPTGKLRAGLYVGTPTSAIGEGENRRGVGFELGRSLAAALGVPYEPTLFPKNADVLAAMKAGTIDVAFTNASAARARDMDFGPHYIDIELGYLVAPHSPIATIGDVDVESHRIGVTKNSSSEHALPHLLHAATVTPMTNFAEGIAALRAGGIDAYATNKASLYEMAHALVGARVLDGAWGTERHAVAVPKGRDEGRQFIADFTRASMTNGLVDGAMRRAGLLGAHVATQE